MQKWRPTPKLAMPVVSRSRSKRSGSGNWRGSRLADPASSNTRSPAGIVVLCSVTSVVVTRASIWLEVS